MQEDTPWPEIDPEAASTRVLGPKDQKDSTRGSGFSCTSNNKTTYRSYNILNLMKIYTRNEDKYGGLPTENFNRKVLL